MKNETNRSFLNRAPAGAVACTSLIARLALYLGIAAIAIVFLHGVVFRFSDADPREPEMQVNFGRDWREVMHDAEQTNHIQFQRMQAILKQIEGQDLVQRLR